MSLIKALHETGIASNIKAIRKKHDIWEALSGKIRYTTRIAKVCDPCAAVGEEK